VITSNGTMPAKTSSIEQVGSNCYVIFVEPLCLLYSKRLIKNSHEMRFILKFLFNCN